VERVRNVLAIGRINFPISSQCYHTHTGIAQGAQPFVILLAGSVPEGQIVVPIIYGYVAGVIVEHCGYVLLGELVPCVGYQHAGFAHHAIAHDGYFQRARTLRYVRRHSRFFPRSSLLSKNCKEDKIEASQSGLQHLVADVGALCVYLGAPTLSSNRKSPGFAPSWLHFDTCRIQQKWDYCSYRI